MNHGLEAKVDFASADDLGDILRWRQHLYRCVHFTLRTLGSLGSSKATLIPSSLK